MLVYPGLFKHTFTLVLAAVAAIALSGCQMGYIANNGYEQMKLLNARVPISKVISDPKTEAPTKAKLTLAVEAKDFAESRLHLKKTKNYSSFVDLKRPYVTYAVSAAPKNKLEFYTWHFPIIGSVPYKGYFNKEKADVEAAELSQKNLDVYVRGVSAYSTLGWFNDPVLSSMLRYSDYDLVNTIIHETVHATLYIKSNANFNERLATYLGDLGTEMFYKEKYPQLLDTLKEVAVDNEEQKLFAEFISSEIKALEEWYKAHAADADILTAREAQFQKIKDSFVKNLKPKLKSNKYSGFEKIELNNARLLSYKLYMNDLSDFAKLSVKFNADFEKILDYCKSLSKSKNPEADLKAFVTQ